MQTDYSSVLHLLGFQHRFCLGLQSTDYILFTHSKEHLCSSCFQFLQSSSHWPPRLYSKPLPFTWSHFHIHFCLPLAQIMSLCGYKLVLLMEFRIVFVFHRPYLPSPYFCLRYNVLSNLGGKNVNTYYSTTIIYGLQCFLFFLNQVITRKDLLLQQT